MIKINPNPEFTSDVDITIPGEEKPGSISLTFRYRNFDDLKSWLKKNTDRPVAEVFTEFVVAWNGIDSELTTENVNTFLLNYPAAGQEILAAYKRLLLGSRIKN